VILIATSEECGDVGFLQVDTSEANMDATERDSECGKNTQLLIQSIVADN
jgi:hypothetical protein